MKNLIEGAEGTKICLSFFRPGPVEGSSSFQSTLYNSSTGTRVPGFEFDCTIYRARSELSDIQIATLQDVHEMIADEKNVSVSQGTKLAQGRLARGFLVLQHVRRPRGALYMY